MAFKMKGSLFYGKGNQSKSSPATAKNLGSFIDGERATYADAEKAFAAGGNVTHTNDEALKHNADAVKNATTEKEKKDARETQAAQIKANYKGPGGKGQKAFNQAKIDDRKAQDSIEQTSKNVKIDNRRKAAGHSTLANKKGYKGTLGQRYSDEAFDEKNKDIKTTKETMPNTKGTRQIVDGAHTTVSSKGARKNPDKGEVYVKNKADYRKEALQKRLDADRYGK